MLIAVLRRPQGLFGLCVTRDSPFAVPPKDAACAAALYKESVHPLDSCRQDPHRPIPRDAPESLESVRKPSSQVLASALRGSVHDAGAHDAEYADTPTTRRRTVSLAAIILAAKIEDRGAGWLLDDITTIERRARGENSGPYLLFFTCPYRALTLGATFRTGDSTVRKRRIQAAVEGRVHNQA